MPSGRDQGWVVAKLNAVENVEHELCWKLVDRESVERLELQAGLKTLLN